MCLKYMTQIVQNYTAFFKLQQKHRYTEYSMISLYK